MLPTTQVPAFDVKQEWVTEIEGQKMDSYIDWMRSCYFITVTALPAISVPCGFTPEGLPVGLQIVGRVQAEMAVQSSELRSPQAWTNMTRRWGQSSTTVGLNDHRLKVGGLDYD